MRVIRNDVIPFKGFKAVNLFGVLFARRNAVLSESDIRHEMIHTAQMRELLYAGFYLWYGMEWLIRWFGCGFKAKKAYRDVCFEREAYGNERTDGYLIGRKRYESFKYLKGCN